MATRKRDERARARALSRETLIGRDVLYVMTDGTTVRPAKIVDVDDERDDAELRATLAIFTAGALDRGLVEHAERGDGVGREPTVIVRQDVLNVQEPLEGEHEFQGTNGNRCAICREPPVGANGHLTHPRVVLWPGHTWHVPPAPVRVSGTAPTEAPPAYGALTPARRQIVGLEGLDGRKAHEATPVTPKGEAYEATPATPKGEAREPDAEPEPEPELEAHEHEPDADAEPREPDATP